MSGVRYWALGGEQVAEECALVNGAVVRFAGSPLCRDYDEQGRHGCTLVTVDGQDQISTQHVETDDVTWLRLSVAIGAGEPAAHWEDRLLARAAEAARAQSGSLALVRFTVEGPPEVVRRARREGLPSRWLRRLRSEFGQGASPVWTEQVELRAQVETSGEAHASESLAGEYLAAVRRLEQSPREEIDLEPYRQECSGGVPARASELTDPHVRRQALAQSAALGVEAILGQEAQA